MSAPTQTRSTLQLKPLEIAAGATAAVVAAFASSFLGVAGTMIGTALASVVTTVSAAVVRHSAERTNERLRRTNARLRSTLRQRAGPGTAAAITGDGATAEHDPGSTDLPTAPATDDAGEPTSGEPVHREPAGGDPGSDGPDRASPGSGDPGSGDPEQPAAAAPSPMWTRKRLIAVGAGSLIAFALALGAVTGLESVLGKPLSALLGDDSGHGTTIGQVVSGGGERTVDRPDNPVPTAGTTVPGSTTPSADQSATGAPTTSPTEATTGPPSPLPPSPTVPAPSPTPTGPAPSPTPPPPAGTPGITP